MNMGMNWQLFIVIFRVWLWIVSPFTTARDNLIVWNFFHLEVSIV